MAHPIRFGALARLLVPAAGLLLAGCRDSVLGLGAASRARGNADQLFSALGDRFDNVAFTPKYEYSRLQITRGALSPSRVFDDSAAWTGSSRTARLLESGGSYERGRYILASRAGVPAATRLADTRHLTALSRIGDGVFRWDTNVDFALGSARPADVALAVSRLIAAGEGRTERDVRADLATSMPRTSAVLGTAFSLDSVHPVPLADGSTLMTLGIEVHSDQLKRRYPAFGEFVHKYVDPARYRFVLSDRAGVAFLEASAKDRQLVIRVRTQRGHMVPLTGPARPMPDSLLLLADFSVKIKIFTVGFHDLSLDFVNEARSDRERGWSVTARREPQWDLPFMAARLIRSPLRRPFAAEGALFRIGVRAGDGDAPTLLVRQARLAVEESAILKFLNSLSSSAMDDFGVRVETEENAFLHELFAAMRADAAGVR